MDGIIERLESDWKLVQRFRRTDPDSYDRAGVIKVLSGRDRAGSGRMSDIEAWMTKIETLYQKGLEASTKDKRTAYMAEVQDLYEPKPTYHPSPRSAHVRTKRRFHARWTEGDYTVRGEIPRPHYGPDTEQPSQTNSSDLEAKLEKAKKAHNETAITELTRLIELRDHGYTRH